MELYLFHSNISSLSRLQSYKTENTLKVKQILRVRNNMDSFCDKTNSYKRNSLSMFNNRMVIKVLQVLHGETRFEPMTF